ncbi:NleF caspase inhibitor [Yersinia pseudotuberculosis]|uniref:NleF caspase inhibitor n=1 Tax=Yersinia pseudotuberculosis TaxID=633 RepID=UPI002B2C2712|nr:NleF caspase inhibitor [Yersinia pseudotuberculosis]
MNISGHIATGLDYGWQGIGYLERGVHWLKTGLDAVGKCAGLPELQPAVYLSSLNIKYNKIDQDTQETLKNINDKLHRAFLLTSPEQIEEKQKIIDAVSDDLEKMKRNVLSERGDLYCGEEVKLHGKMRTTLSEHITVERRDNFIRSLVNLYQIVRGVKAMIANAPNNTISSLINSNTNESYNDLVKVDAVLARDFNAIEKNNRVPNVIVDTHFYE